MNQQFAGKLNGKQKAIGFILLIPIYMHIAPMFIQAGLYLYIKYVQSLDRYTINILLNFFIAVVIFVFEIVVFKDFLIENIKKFKEKILDNITWSLTAGIGVMYAISMITNMVISSFLGHANTSSNQLLFESLLDKGLILMIIQSVILAPIVEEVIFRGLIFRTLRDYNKYMAHFVSALCFGFIHIYSGLFAGDLTQLFYLLSYGGSGLAFSYAYEARKTIVAPIIIHMVNNLIAVIVLCL